MPTSHWLQLNEIISVVKILSPGSVLDIGVGFGKFGVLAREYLELWDGRNQYRDWRCQIDGIEAFIPYRNPIYSWAYNTVHQGDAQTILPTLQDYDLILLVDVLEHFTEQQGRDFLSCCSKKSKNLLIATPLRVSPQEAPFGNEFERHRSAWTVKSLSFLGEQVILDNSRSLISVTGKNLGNLFGELSTLFRVMKAGG